MKSSADTKNLGGRPATGQGTPVVVRMHPPMLAAVDAWAIEQGPPVPSRPEAVRRALENFFRDRGQLAEGPAINVDEAWEVEFWTKKWGVTREQIMAAVKAVGRQPAAVAQHLGKTAA